MNPKADRFKIDRFKEILEQIERLGRPEYFPELEEIIIREIARLIAEGTEEAKADLKKLEKIFEEEIGSSKNQLRISALKNSIKGALSVAKLCLL